KPPWTTFLKPTCSRAGMKRVWTIWPSVSKRSLSPAGLLSPQTKQEWLCGSGRIRSTILRDEGKSKVEMGVGFPMILLNTPGHTEPYEHSVPQWPKPKPVGFARTGGIWSRYFEGN